MAAVEVGAVVKRNITASATVLGPRAVGGHISHSPMRLTPITITENGTYTAPVGTGYSPIVANVADGLPWADEYGGGF